MQERGKAGSGGLSDEPGGKITDNTEIGQILDDYKRTGDLRRAATLAHHLTWQAFAEDPLHAPLPSPHKQSIGTALIGILTEKGSTENNGTIDSTI